MYPSQADVKPASIRERLGERRRASSKSPEADERWRGGNAAKMLKYNMDVRLVQCIICKKELTPPIIQCKNGHMACQFCCKTRTRGECPKCSQPIGRMRNRAVEEMVASLQSPCKHAENGCKRMLPSVLRKQHELYECEFMLLRCPFPDCRFTSFSRNFSSHLEHKHNDTRLIERGQEPEEELLTFNLDPRDEFVQLMSRPEMFLLHQEDTPLGKMIYVTDSSCTGKNSRYSVEVVLSNDYERAGKSFKMDTVTSYGRSSLKDFLLLPKQNCGSARRSHHVNARCTVVIQSMN